MFLIDCPTHETPVLVPETRIRALANTDTGVVVVIRCWCGTFVRLRGDSATVPTPTSA